MLYRSVFFPNHFDTAAQIKFREEHLKTILSLWPEIYHLWKVLQTVLAFGERVWNSWDTGQMEIEILLLMGLPPSVDSGRESTVSLDLGGKQLFRWGKGSSVEIIMFSIRKTLPVHAGGKGKLASISLPVNQGKKTLEFSCLVKCNTLFQETCRASCNPAENRARNILETKATTTSDESLLFL